MHAKNQREKELFIRYGSAASEAMFDFPCKFFHLPDCKGVIAYRELSKCAVVFGEPICPPKETEKFAQSFQQFCHDSKLTLIYIIASEKFAQWIQNHSPHVSMKVCDEYIINPVNDLCETSQRMRQRVNKAKKHGLTLHEYIPYDAKIEKTLKEIAYEWQKAIKGPNIYLGHFNFFEDYIGKRWFYVKDGSTITGMIMLSRIDKSNGWLLKFLITKSNAFPDTSEFLMTSVLDILRSENCRFLSKGSMPSNALESIQGLGPISNHFAKKVYTLISSIFKFEQRKAYWLRYNPKTEPAYLIICRPRIGSREIRALLQVFRTSLLSK